MNEDKRALSNHPVTVVVKPSELRQPIQIVNQGLTPQQLQALLDTVSGIKTGPAGLAQAALLVESGSSIKISALPSATTLGGSEVFPVVQSGSDKQASVNQVVTFVETQLPGILVESGPPIKISSMPAASALAGTEIFPVVQGGVDKGATANQLATFIDAGAGTVTSVTITVPSWLSVSPATITTSGTFAITAATGQTKNQFLATPNGSSGSVALRDIVAADVPTLNQSTSGNAATVTTNANLTGPVTSVGNATTITATGVSAATYTNATVTVNAAGQVTAASSGAATFSLAPSSYLQTSAQTMSTSSTTVVSTSAFSGVGQVWLFNCVGWLEATAGSAFIVNMFLQDSTGTVWAWASIPVPALLAATQFSLATSALITIPSTISVNLKIQLAATTTATVTSRGTSDGIGPLTQMTAIRVG